MTLCRSTTLLNFGSYSRQQCLVNASNGPRNLDRVISEIFDLETDFIRLPGAA
jgi:hypothetical protein